MKALYIYRQGYIKFDNAFAGPDGGPQHVIAQTEYGPMHIPVDAEASPLSMEIKKRIFTLKGEVHDYAIYEER